MSLVICGASRGHYGPPWRIDGARGIKQWVNEEDKRMRPPEFISCEGPEHWDPKDGRRRRYLRQNCSIQKWVLTKAELKAAIRDYDMLSLDMPPRLLCPFCARTERVRKV